MNKPSGTRHKNYEILNLIGYGLAKFEGDLVAALGFKTKSALFNYLIWRGVAETKRYAKESSGPIQSAGEESQGRLVAKRGPVPSQENSPRFAFRRSRCRSLCRNGRELPANLLPSFR